MKAIETIMAVGLSAYKKLVKAKDTSLEGQVGKAMAEFKERYEPAKFGEAECSAWTLYWLVENGLISAEDHAVHKLVLRALIFGSCTNASACGKAMKVTEPTAEAIKDADV